MGDRQFETRRLVMLALLSSLLSYAFSAIDVLYTLYALNDIRISASEWSQVRALRYAMTIVVVAVLGTYAGRLGQRKAGAVTSALAVSGLLLFVAFPTKTTLYVTFPLHAAFVSMITLSVNVLVQDVPDRLQTTSNTLYRSTFTGMAIVGPLTLGILSDADQAALFLLFIACFALCVPGFDFYPKAADVSGVPKTSRSFRDQWGEWKVLVGNRRFAVFETLITLIYSAFIANIVLGPAKLIQTVGLTERQYSYVFAGAAVATMLCTLAAGFLLARRLRQLVYVPLFLSSFGTILLGWQSNAPAAVALFVVTNALNAVTFASASIWTGRLVGRERLGHAYALHKIMIAAIGFAFSLGLAALEGLFGIDWSLMAMGSVGCLCSLLLRRSMKEQSKHDEQQSTNGVAI